MSEAFPFWGSSFWAVVAPKGREGDPLRRVRVGGSGRCEELGLRELQCVEEPRCEAAPKEAEPGGNPCKGGRVGRSQRSFQHPLIQGMLKLRLLLLFCGGREGLATGDVGWFAWRGEGGGCRVHQEMLADTLFFFPSFFSGGGICLWGVFVYRETKRSIILLDPPILTHGVGFLLKLGAPFCGVGILFKRKGAV